MSAARYIWIHDSLRPASEGVVPFVSAAVQYGFSVFEGIRCYSTDKGPAVFRMNEHVERLLDSAHIIGFRDLPVTSEQVENAINQTIAANEFAACYIRPMIFLDGAMSLTVEAGEPRFVVAVWEWKTVSGRGGERTRHPRQYCVVHAAASEHHDDQGQGLGKLCELDSGQDRVPARRIR